MKLLKIDPNRDFMIEDLPTLGASLYNQLNEYKLMIDCFLDSIN